MSNLAYKVQQQRTFVEQPKPTEDRLFKRKITKGEKFLWTLAVCGLFLASVYLVSTYATVFTLNEEIEQLQSDLKTQEKVNGELEQQVAKLSRPERIFSIAKNELGMTFKENSVKVIGK
ncbi:MAG TPA: cell division protein FtsL [Bacillales bacterium]|nr:cell division protein FtsL [Bacillales bacterium]